ncbi:MAG: Wzz/FepE/Etk N-terminal domain-containing protein [Prevotella sp.]|nr:Wzz/FepE/Etk N-terminal domain-containing protein [Bacteroides sp.]MCM1366854.1 Wzz/FepE/Etk N-terminal domain-containing protein [Prevotella sp.]MCM1437420.1 Wzz/FepE/Etk N-terminal domain-containing protein [Prevotella sp.]
MEQKKTSDLVANDKKALIGPLLAYLIHYWWAILSVAIIFGVLGYIYSCIRTNKLESRASIILNDTENDGKGTLSGTGLGSLFSSFNMGGASFRLVEDEVKRIQSRPNLEKVIRMLNLNSVSWSKAGFFKPKIHYYHDEPLIVTLPQQVLDTISATTKFDIKVNEGASDIHVIAQQPLGKEVVNQTYHKFPIKVKTPRGTFTINKSATYNPTEPLHFYNLTYNPKKYCEILYKKLDLASPTKKSNIIYLSIEDVRDDKGCETLNNLITIYNNQTIDIGHEEARAAIDFIDGRMVELYSQLQKSEQNIEDYKKVNKISDPEIDAKYTLEKKGVAESALLEQRTKAGVTQMIIDFLRNDGTKYSMIPFTADSPEAPIQAYNDLVMERMRLEQNAKGNNSTLKGVTAQIDAMRANLISSLERDLSATKIALSDLQRVNSESDARIGKVPAIERKLTELYRNQTIQNQIYAFLLQKREENQLKLSREIPAGRIMEDAYCDDDGGIGGKILAIIFAFFGACLAIVGLTLIFRFQARRDRLAEITTLYDAVEQKY